MSTTEAPETLEGWYVQHDVYTVNWPQWRAVAPSQRAAIIAASTAWCTEQATPAQGSSAFFSVLGQKGDLLAVHFRPSLEALNGVELSLRQTEVDGEEVALLSQDTEERATALRWRRLLC